MGCFSITTCFQPCFQRFIEKINNFERVKKYALPKIDLKFVQKPICENVLFYWAAYQSEYEVGS